jgi:hypothetical protein
MLLVRASCITLLLRTQIFEHIIGDCSIDVFSVQVERNEHDPRPESDPKVELDESQPPLSLAAMNILTFRTSFFSSSAVHV